MWVLMVNKIAFDFGNLDRVSLSHLVLSLAPAFSFVMDPSSAIQSRFTLAPLRALRMMSSSSGWKRTGLSVICVRAHALN